jgi:hypothetical protein
MKNAVLCDIMQCGSCRSLLIRATRRNIPGDVILLSYRRENLRSYIDYIRLCVSFIGNSFKFSLNL